jgi:hypothetical protein
LVWIKAALKWFSQAEPRGFFPLAEALLAKVAVVAGCQQSQLLLRATLNGLWPIQRPSA